MTAADRKQQQAVIAHWREGAERDWVVAQDNFQSGHYNWTLFLCHISIEKLLKALVVRAEQTPPFTHDLAKLWKLTSLPLSAEYWRWLTEIERFNIEGRYDDEKQSFYLKATKAYTELWLARCTEVFQWLEKQFD